MNSESGEGQVNGCKRIDSCELFEGKRRIIIVHEGVEYFMQITKQNKLILTK